jgi:hypothetical protein
VAIKDWPDTLRVVSFPHVSSVHVEECNLSCPQVLFLLIFNSNVCIATPFAFLLGKPFNPWSAVDYHRAYVSDPGSPELALMMGLSLLNQVRGSGKGFTNPLC